MFTIVEIDCDTHGITTFRYETSDGSGILSIRLQDSSEYQCHNVMIKTKIRHTMDKGETRKKERHSKMIGFDEHPPK